MSTNTAENLYEIEEDEVKTKVFNLKGCSVTWHKTKEVEPQGNAHQGSKSIEIIGKKSPELAWVLAHELAHVLEPEEKKPQETIDETGDVISLFLDFFEDENEDVETNDSTSLTDEDEDEEDEPALYYVDFQDIQSRRHKMADVVGNMSQEEFQASRRSKQYLKLACGALGISLKKAVLSNPAEGLKHHPDKGYFYQWRTQMDERFKKTDRRELKRAGARARFKRQEPLDTY